MFLFLCLVGLVNSQSWGYFQNHLRCGAGFINPYTSFCCNEISHPRSSSADSCCAGTTFRTRESLCCGAQLIPRRGDRHSTCCGLSSFNYFTQRCCAGKVHEFVPGAKCCGSNQYEPSTALCCNGQLKHKDTRDTACCGKAAYDKHTQVCCNGKVLTKPSKSGACCANDVFDIVKESCCNGVVKTKVPEVGCCGGREFNTTGNLCCNEEVRHRPGPYSGKHFYKCCRNNVHDERETKCCAGDIYKPRVKPRQLKAVLQQLSCCGKKSFNVRTHICCNNVVVRKGHPVYTVCCGTAVYDKRSQFCCNGLVGNGRIHTCCGGIIQPKRAKMTSCCGASLYDTNEYICCRNSLVPTTKGDEEFVCCGSNAMNSSAAVCCMDEIITVNPDEGAQSCCYMTPYNHITQMCCGHNVIDKGENDACCGLVAFDTDKKQCCHYNLHDLLIPNQRCCGKETYDPSSHTCCGGYVIPISALDDFEQKETNLDQPNASKGSSDKVQTGAILSNEIPDGHKRSDTSPIPDSS